SRLRVRDVHLPGDGVGHHVEENRAHAGVRHPHLGRRAPRGIDYEHVLVEQREADGVVPVPAELVLPRVVCRVELDDHARLRLRGAVVMKARLPPGPANTMSRGSSPTRSVRTTRGGLELTSTMLTLSERWLTTQTCRPSPWAAAATGSRPTGTEPECVRFPCASMSKISS